MIESLRRKFILITMISTILVITVVISIINISNYTQIQKTTSKIMDILLSNDGHFPQKIVLADDSGLIMPVISLETPYSTRFFTAIIDDSSTEITIDIGKIAAISTQQAQEYAARALQSGRTTGIFDIYKYSIQKTEDGNMIVFLDCRRELNTFYNFLINSILVSVLSIISIFILVVIFSKKAIKPVVLSYEKQKRFITDAGHELKTPLSVINANTEVMEIKFGESEWTRSTKNQIERLSDLTHNLVSLSRMEEEHASIQSAEFSLSDAVNDTIQLFMPLSQLKHLDTELHIVPNLTLKGDEKAIRQLLSILLDNAVKYTPEYGNIKLTLKKQGKKVLLTVYNTVESIPKGNLDVLFERFYRTDFSRNSETGGYGIGLSIAKAIVSLHKGKISAASADGASIQISVFL